VRPTRQQYIKHFQMTLANGSLYDMISFAGDGQIANGSKIFEGKKDYKCFE